MGVKSVFHYRVVGTDTYAFTEMQKRIQQLKPEKASYPMTCALHLSVSKQATNDTRELFVLTFDDKPRKCFLMIKDCIVEADRDMSVLMERTKSYVPRQAVTISGYQYRIGDFMVKIGVALLGNAGNTRGVIVEIEYTPCHLIEMARGILEEFTSNLGPFEDNLTPIGLNFTERADAPSTSGVLSSTHVLSIRATVQESQRIGFHSNGTVW
ncbi:hypothetical protein PROFUN_07913 [Planoprotostelium fungivorum]|uniref:Mediator of RNA polymerase II transcription subunit 20 n=1 Tax=Planoprotostelium fungivorum TaxID=1890364 RepID=A0A2P6NL37_9EUKA|nr:hypothetical protein PROFUN_07913 [Planoprotostelium fungivorum]